ncbi:nuclear transport factor 2 family protein [Pedobacter cryoconitis]|uniref:Ketosteroid isomerase-like protein n=1 Tax=Pedobacter cryoconitis TaxID=188932 RepID=A0A7X0MJY9_9SPHI|nr:nuclear transport factor 2 family protein [Pedobacter cryoconitis]MBB6502007.1 ketosteroid isomerase-like protein [Pedobacter cryoconitis]
MFKEDIITCEKRLLEAIRLNDVSVLDELLHQDLLFTTPQGQTISKAQDMENYHSGNIAITHIESADQAIHLIGDTAVVAVTINLQGKYLVHSLDGNYRYTRVWKNIEDSWKVIAGSSVQL